jgi:hypothetical protein
LGQSAFKHFGKPLNNAQYILDKQRCIF